jgi:hypothetical protein
MGEHESHSLVRGLFFNEYWTKNILTMFLKKNLSKSWKFSLYYYVKVYVKDFKNYFTFKSFNTCLQIIFVFKSNHDNV